MKEYVLNVNYAKKRETKLSLRYRLKRRTFEVAESIKKFKNDAKFIADIGTAEGRMISLLKKKYFNDIFFFGLEYNFELCKYGKRRDSSLFLIQADAEKLPYRSECCDTAIATAVVEHLNDPIFFFKNVNKILKPEGILIITAPHPFWEKVASLIGHLPKEQHNKIMSIKEIEKLGKQSGFILLESKKFMFSPVGFPLEILIENFLRKLRMDFLMANQLLVFRK